jgi:hypothetical protein
MERKYRQRGYQDHGSRPKEVRREHKAETFGPKTPLMPDKHLVSRCARCGKMLPSDFDPAGQCPHCGFQLHSCKQCAYFDTSARFECTQPIPARIVRKDARNECAFYSPRLTIERQTSPGSPRVGDARQAFEALFKK